MSKIKIHEIAKKIGVVSKEVVAKANEIGINVSSHLSTVEENEANKIIEAFENKTEKKKVEDEKNKKQEINKRKSRKSRSKKFYNTLERIFIIKKFKQDCE